MICLRKYLRDNQPDAKDTPQAYYELLIMEKLINIFKWTGLPDGMSGRDIEGYLQFTHNATCAIVPRKTGPVPYDCEYIAVPVSRSGDISVYNLGMDFIYAVPGQEGGFRCDSPSAVIGYNNLGMLPSRLLVLKYADLLEEIDKSLKIGIIRTRATKIFELSTDTQIISAENIMDSVINGEYYSFVSNDNFKNLVTGEPGNLKEYDLSSGYTASDLLSLLQVRKEIFANMLMEIGIPIADVPKKSQVNSDEIMGYTDYALFTVYDMLYARKKMVKEMNDKFGMTVKVDFSEGIKNIIKREENKNEKKTDGTSTDTDRRNYI